MTYEEEEKITEKIVRYVTYIAKLAESDISTRISVYESFSQTKKIDCEGEFSIRLEEVVWIDGETRGYKLRVEIKELMAEVFFDTEHNDLGKVRELDEMLNRIIKKANEKKEIAKALKCYLESQGYSFS